MPAYNSFNLAQSRTPITNNYYSGLAAQSTPNSGVTNPIYRAPTTNLTGTAQPQRQYTVGPGGTYGADHPDVAAFLAQFGNRDFLDENGNIMEIPDAGNASSQGRYIINEGNPTLYGRDPSEYMQDPTRIMQLPDGRWIYEAGNIRPGEVAGYQRGAETDRRREYQRNAMIAAAVAAGGYGLYSGGFSAAGGGLPDFSNVVAGGSTTAGGAAPAATPSLWETIRSGASSLMPSGGPVQLSGPGSTMTGTLIDGAATGGAGSLLNNPLVRGGANVIGQVAGAIGEHRNQRDYQNTINSLVERGDTWGPEGREFAKRKLFELFNDPSSIENTPGYKFARDQGEQGVQRGAAGKGYFRSPNMLFDLSQFNQGLASKTWNDEFNKYAQMAGLSFNPASSAQIGASGAQQSANMRGNTLDAILAAGGSFIDWLNGAG